MKKILIILLVVFVALVAVGCDELLDDNESKEKTFRDETIEERTYNNVVYEEAYYEYNSYKDRHGNRSHTDYYLLDEDNKRIIDCHIYYNKSKNSATGKTSYTLREGTYTKDNDDSIHTSFKGYENGKEITYTTEAISVENRKEITVQKAILEIEICKKNSKLVAE